MRSLRAGKGPARFAILYMSCCQRWRASFPAAEAGDSASISLERDADRRMLLRWR
jgi:hypothetical protein